MTKRGGQTVTMCGMCMVTECNIQYVECGLRQSVLCSMCTVTECVMWYVHCDRVCDQCILDCVFCTVIGLVC